MIFFQAFAFCSGKYSCINVVKLSFFRWTPTGSCLNYQKLTSAVGKGWFGHIV